MQRVCQGMHDDASYHRCGDQEMILHGLRDCPGVRCVWEQLFGRNIPTQFDAVDCSVWMDNAVHGWGILGLEVLGPTAAEIMVRHRANGNNGNQMRDQMVQVARGVQAYLP